MQRDSPKAHSSMDIDESNEVVHHSVDADNLFGDDEPELRLFWEELKDMAKGHPEAYLHISKKRLPYDSAREKMHSILLPNYKDFRTKGLASTHPSKYRALKAVLTEEQWETLGSVFLLEDKPLEDCGEHTRTLVALNYHLERMLSPPQWERLHRLLGSEVLLSDLEGEDTESSDEDDIFDLSYEDLECADLSATEG